MDKQRSFHPARVVFIIFSAVIMAAIFYLSCENADKSSDTSGFFTDFVVGHFVKDFDGMSLARQEEIISGIDHIVRKTAHFTAYAALGFCVSASVGRRKVLSPGSLLTLGICFLYACSDELHQYFVPGRACMFTDVLIDTAGALTGMLLSLGAMLTVYALLAKMSHNK